MTVTFATKLVTILGDKSAKSLAKAFGLATVGDLLRHYPRRYAEIGKPTDLTDLRTGQHVTILAEIVEAKNYSYGSSRRQTRTEVIVTDGTGRLTLTFFGQGWLQKRLQSGMTGLFSGEVTEFNRKLQLTHPDFDLLDEAGDVAESRLARGVLPLYRATAKLTSWQIEKCVGLCLDALDEVADPIPAEVLARHSFLDARSALERIHRPHSRSDHQRARARFRFEEAFVIQTVFALRRVALAGERATPRPRAVEEGLRSRFEQRLPFSLTAGQQTVIGEIAQDLAQSHPMHRLLQGEVGSGKTVVALLAMLQVVDGGGQAAMLAPTEVLAAQHHRAITAMLGDLAKGGMLGAADGATRVRLLTGSMGAKARKASLLDAASGEAGIVIGTHALIQEHVQFAELGLVVVDEQHRFGVEQRAALADKAELEPHTLVMTATPIPRTVAMTAFGDLEVSTLRELPAGRQPIQTNVVPVAEKPAWLARVWERVGEEVAKGRQAYVVVSRIGAGGKGVADDEPEPDPLEPEPDRRETHALLELFTELANGPLKGLRLGMLHGRMAAEDKDAAMTAFGAHEIDVLVATTVVEVGVDVPNASVMVVVDADRFGMSQLHQLRGRVGRGTQPGLCLLVTDTGGDSPSRERLDAVASTTDGFELSRLDVELRREGDVLGSAQSGVRSSLRLLSVVRDESVIVEARGDADGVVAADPSLAAHPVLAAAVRTLEATDQADYLERT